MEESKLSKFLKFVMLIDDYGTDEEKIKLVEVIASATNIDGLPTRKLDLV